MNWGLAAYEFMTPIEPLIAITFIFLAGVCCSLSHSNLLRALRLLAVSVLVTLVTVFFTPGNEIYFGVLHFLAVSMMLYSLLERPLGKLPELLSAAVCLALYFILWGVPYGYLGLDFLRLYELPRFLYGFAPAAFLGFPSDGFFSADYFPMIPHLFLFLSGCFFGRLGLKKGFPDFLRPLRLRPLAFLGRHSLIIYVLHQPVLIAALYLISLIPA